MKKINKITFRSKLKTRDINKKKYLEGYFIKFNERTMLQDGIYETIVPEAVESSLLNEDIICLFNHDEDKVLGRTGNNTLELRADRTGLYGRVEINESDQEALAVYARVSRGDIKGCSFGFIPKKEETRKLEDGSIEFIILDAEIKEVSIVTFPAYPTTQIEARKSKIKEIREKELDKMSKLFNSSGQEIIKNENVIQPELRTAIKKYVSRDKDISQEFKTKDGHFLIPESIIKGTSIENTVNLKNLVKVIKVKTGKGKYPTRKLAESRLYSVDELEKNPELLKPEWIETEFAIKTYRGMLPISMEAIEDSAIDLADEIVAHIEELKINTENYEIAQVLKEFEKKEVSSLDDIKTLLNVELKAGYQRQSVVSQSFYNKLDIAKNNKGDYIGKEIIKQMNIKEIVPDSLLGNEGEAKAFVGDLERAVLFADRKRVMLQWHEHQVHGHYLAGVMRMDIVKNDKDAGFLVTFV